MNLFQLAEKICAGFEAAGQVVFSCTIWPDSDPDITDPLTIQIGLGTGSQFEYRRSDLLKLTERDDEVGLNVKPEVTDANQS